MMANLNIKSIINNTKSLSSMKVDPEYIYNVINFDNFSLYHRFKDYNCYVFRVYEIDRQRAVEDYYPDGLNFDELQSLFDEYKKEDNLIYISIADFN